MEEKHFFVVHTFVSDEARKDYLTPKKKENHPKREKQSASGQREHQKANMLNASRRGVVMKNFSIVIGSPRVKTMFTDN